MLQDASLPMHLSVASASGYLPVTLLPPEKPVCAEAGAPQSHLGQPPQVDFSPSRFFHPLATWVPAGTLAHRLALAPYLPRQPRRRRPVPVLRPGADPFAPSQP